MIAITIINSSSEKPRHRAGGRSAGRTKENGDGSVGICAQEAIRRILAGRRATL
ncbi:MAG TPA: hypothetical protein VL624_17145 [Caldimonas sp.]|jgi:hypothetical protein|nr:hypothetical protein [Caldimonas sp.]